MLKLIIEDDEGRKTVVPFLREEITIGRQEGNTIRLTERNVSRRHARLLRQNGHVLIEDLHSAYGILVNGDRIAGPVQVKDGDLIQIGDYDLAIQVEQQAQATVPLDETAPGLGGASPTQPLMPTVAELPRATEEATEEAPLGEEETPESIRRQSTAVIRAESLDTNRRRALVDIDLADAPRLVVLNTDFAGREFACTRSELKIGRTDDNDIALDHRSLSRTHCKVVREDSGEWRVIDLQSANGLMVNGEPYAQVTLRPGDVIELGHVKLQFLAPGEPPPARPALSDTRETRAARSRLPRYAVGTAVAALLLGLGGYALLRGRTGVPPDAAEAEPAPPARAPVDPEGARRQVEQKLTRARTAIEALDWPTAEALLRTCRQEGGALVPEAAQLLEALDAERGFRVALEEAARQLDLGDTERARTQLELAAPTRLLAARYQALEARLPRQPPEKAATRRPPGAQATPVAVASPQRTDPTRARTEEAEALYQESRDLVKAQQLEAAVLRLEKCIKLAPMYYACYKSLGSAHAKIASRDNSESERAKGRKFYERYLELAPPDDKDVPKVRGILEKAADRP